MAGEERERERSRSPGADHGERAVGPPAPSMPVQNHGADGAPGTDTEPAQSLDKRILAMKAEQNDLSAKRKQVRKDAKNAERKRQRLKNRARNLSDADLEELISMRKAKASASSGEATSGSGSTGSAPTSPV